MSMCLSTEVFIPTECCGSCNTYRIQNDIFSFVQWWLKEIIVMNTKMNENSTCTLKSQKIFSTLKFKFSFVFFKHVGMFLYLDKLNSKLKSLKYNAVKCHNWNTHLEIGIILVWEISFSYIDVILTQNMILRRVMYWSAQSSNRRAK